MPIDGASDGWCDKPLGTCDESWVEQIAKLTIPINTGGTNSSSIHYIAKSQS